MRGARQRVVSLEFDTNAGQVALIDVVVISEEGELLDREGKVVQRYSGGKPIRWVAKVAPTAQAWEILDLLNFGPAAP